MSAPAPAPPSLDQLRIQAKELLKSARSADPAALERLRRSHPELSGVLDPSTLALHHAQLVLAREHGFPSWPKLKADAELRSVKGELDRAIQVGDLPSVPRLVGRYPRLAQEPVRSPNWGRPLSHAAQFGKLEIVRWLRTFDRGDLQHPLSRAAMRAHRGVMAFLVSEGADPNGPYAEGAENYGTPMTAVAEVQNADGMQALIDLGARLTWRVPSGEERNPISMLVGTYSRNPAGKHACLEVCAKAGLALPDTPVMALHRGRIDLLQEHLARDPSLLGRRFSEAEIYPPELGLEPGEGMGLTPVRGTTLLHLAVEFDELEIQEWLLDRGADPNARADVDAEGFGGHTPLFHAVVGRRDDMKARLLLDRGADPNLRASIRKALRDTGDPAIDCEHRFLNVTPLGFGLQFPWKPAVSEPTLELLRERGGTE